MGFELGTDGPGAIVVGVDGSDTSMRAAAYGAGLARRQHAKLVLVYVRGQPPAGLLTVADFGGVIAQQAVRTEEDTEAHLRQLLRLVPALDVDVSLIVRSGDPALQLREVADTVQADEIVVGSSAGTRHRFAGAVGVRLVRTRRWPVTVVP
jgi:nucleotide-binding universal stress UspA family protein